MKSLDKFLSKEIKKLINLRCNNKKLKKQSLKNQKEVYYPTIQLRNPYWNSGEQVKAHTMKTQFQ